MYFDVRNENMSSWIGYDVKEKGKSQGEFQGF